MKTAIRRSLAIPALVAGMVMVPVTALAQSPAPQGPASTYSVDIKPVGTTKDDPNGGQWFVANLAPGDTTQLEGEFTNPGETEQTVKVYAADLEFDEAGNPQVVDNGPDLTSWITFPTPTLTIPGRAARRLKFSVTAPDGAEPGDHVGVIIAESAPEGSGGEVAIVKRTAVRTYITVPGDARREFAIEKVTIEPDSWLFPREVTVTTVLRNKGRIRLQPDVVVNGVKARGSQLLMIKSIEPYISTHKIPFWGGPQAFRIDVATRVGRVPGPVSQVRQSTFVFPVHLLFLLAFAGGLTQLARMLLRRRGGKYAALQADLVRIERLLAGGGPRTRRVRNSNDPELAIRAAVKQARRAGDTETEARLRAKLAESARRKTPAASMRAPVEAPPVVAPPVVAPPEPQPLAADELQVTTAERAPAPAASPSAFSAILAELAQASAARVDELISAARAFGAVAVLRHMDEIDKLPPEIRVRLLNRGEPSRVPRMSPTKLEPNDQETVRP